MAQLVLGVAGAAIGGYIGGPQGAQVGFAIGSALGGAYEASQKRIEGPRLGDLRMIGTQYGEPIPWVLGTPRLPGQVWWSSEKREVSTTTSEGKGGGPKVTTFTYEVDAIFGLCEKEILTVGRVWSFGKLVRNTLATADVATLAGVDRTDLWRRFTVYTGAATQLPDPTYEAAVGSGNAPGYRGRAYVFIEGLQLDSAGQLPLLTFEVIESGAVGLAAAAFVPGLEIVAPDPIFNASSISIGPSPAFSIGIPQWDTSYLTTTVQCYDFDLLSGADPEPTNTFEVATSGINPAAHGNSDGPLLVMKEETTVIYTYEIPTGARSVGYECTEDYGFQPVRFAQRGDKLVLGSSSTGSKSIRAFQVGVGAQLVASAALADWVNSIEIIGSAVYCAGVTDRRVFVLDIATLTVQSTINRPSFGGSGTTNAMLFASGGELHLVEVSSFGIASLYRLDGAAWVTVGSILSGFVVGTEGQSIGIVGSLLVSGLVTAPSPSPHIYKVWTAAIAVTPATKTVQESVEEISERAGLLSTQYDASALSTITRPVRAIAVSQVEGMRGVLEQMRTVYGFDCALSDKLRFRPRSATPARTIEFEDLAAGEDEAGDEPCELTISSDLEVPPQIAVQYLNASNDYQIGTEHSDRLVMSTQRATQPVQFGIAMTPAEAKHVADTLAAEGMAQITSARAALSVRHAELEPTDVIDVRQRDGGLMRIRIGRRLDAGGVLTLEGVRVDAATASSSELTDDGYLSGSAVAVPSPSQWRTMDIPILRDEDDGAGWYIAARGVTATWPGALVEQSWNAVDYTTAATVNESAVFGLCSTTLGNFTGVGVDEVNRLTVSVRDGVLESSTRDAMIADQTINVLLVGSEIVRFITATQSSADPNVYVLTRLFRGQRGTESHKAGHAAGEACVLLRPRGLRRIASDVADIGRSRGVRATSLGTSPTYVTPTTFIDTGLALKPFAPVDAEVERDPASNATITWRRRSRLSGRLFGGPPPLGEDAEAYDVLVYDDDTFATLVRTISAATTTASYSAAEQTADGLVPGAPLNLRIYQRSTAYGRGYPLEFAEVAPTGQIEDPYFSLVVLLVHGQGTNGGTTFTDSSSYARAVDSFSGANTSTSQFKFGDSSLAITGGYVRWADSADFTLGTSDFALDPWARFDSTGARQVIFGQANSAGSDSTVSIGVERTAGNKIRAYAVSGITYIADITGTTTIAQDTWYHIAFTRSGSTFRLFVNGALEGSATSASSINDSANKVAAGALGELSGLSLSGFVQDVRLTVGAARYTAAFTPPIAPYPDL